MEPTVQLLAYRFDPPAAFEGRLVGALERMESGGTLRVLDALFVGREPDTGELVAIGGPRGGPGGFVAPLLGFRLDAGERRRATHKAVTAYGEAALQRLAASLAPGGAVAAILVEHVWARALGDAVAASGGTAVLDRFIGGAELVALTDELAAAVAV